MNFLRFREKEIEDKKAQEAIKAQQMAIAQMQNNSQTQLAVTQENNQSLDRREAAKLQSKERIEDKKLGVDVLLSHQAMQAHSQAE